MALPKNGNKEHGSVEIYFAKKLANNDKKVRDRAVKRIRSWLSGRPGDSFTDLDIMKLWKGLFYCMWFSDKPLVQEDLANSLANLVHATKDLSAVCKLFNGFLQTMGREWHGIDRLRLDKFYMLVRKVVNEILQYAHKNEWDADVLDKVCEAFLAGPCCVSSKAFPDGIRMFISEILLDELQKVVGENPPPPAMLSKLIDPFIGLSAQNENNFVFKSIEDEIFKRLLPEEEQMKPNFQIKYETLGTRIFEEAAKEKVSTKRRKKLLRYSAFFKEAKEQNENDSKPENEDATAKEEKKRGKKKAKKRKAEKNENVTKKRVKGAKKAKKDTSTSAQKPSDGEDKKSENADKAPKSEVSNALENPVVDQHSETQDPVVKKLDFEKSVVEDETLKNEKDRKMTRLERRKRRSAPQKIEVDVLKTESIDDVEQPSEGIKKEKIDTPLQLGGNAFEAKTPTAKAKTIKHPMSTRSRKISNNFEAESKNKKKVVFELSRNAVTSISKLKVNPASVFTPEQKPVKSALKNSASRRRASDFF